jgi:hypothetical protein
MKVRSINNKIFYIDNFLSVKKCNILTSGFDQSIWIRSKVIKQTKDNTYNNAVDEARTSQSQFLKIISVPVKSIVEELDDKISKIFDCDISFLEDWQATRYSKMESFDYHLDSGNWQKEKYGNRKRTFLLYLTTNTDGGETHFRAFDLKFSPKAGRLVVWNNLLPSGRSDYAMIHAGLPTISTTKITLVTWERQKKWRQK